MCLEVVIVTTATARDRLTEADIHAVLSAHGRSEWDTKIDDAVASTFDPIGCVSDERNTPDWFSDIWADLRPSEVGDLADLVDAAYRQALEQVRAILIEAAVETALTFDRAHPDARHGRHRPGQR